MSRMKFGCFLAPHHPIGENPILQFRSDLALAQRLDELGFDEFWCGEHHSSGWEMIDCPEMFLAAAGERTHRIKLGTGVISLPYHHPYNVAQRMVQLDLMTNGRAIFGSGPGALPSDAFALGIDPMVQRDRQDEAIGVIKRLMKGERVTHESEWFTLKDARLQLFPVQEDMEFVVASQISPSGMTLAGKYGAGVLSIGSMSAAGLNALPTQWSFAEDAAAKHGQSVDRKNWRVVLTWHLAESREEAARQAGKGLMRWHNEYNVGTLQRPGAVAYASPEDAVQKTAWADGAVSVIGTPDELVAQLKKLRRDLRRLRRGDRLRARLGQSRGHAAQLGSGGPLRRPRDQQLRRGPAHLSPVPDRPPRVVRARRPGDHEQDHGERESRRGAKGDPPRHDGHHRRPHPGPGEGEVQGRLIGRLVARSGRRALKGPGSGGR